MMNLFGHFSFRTGYFGTRRRDFAYRHGTSSSFLLAERVAYRSFCIKSVVSARVVTYCPCRFQIFHAVLKLKGISPIRKRIFEGTISQFSEL